MHADAKQAPFCKLSPEQLAARRQLLIPGLFKRAKEVTDIPNGIRFRFDGAPNLLTDLAKVMEGERDCCSFLRIQVTAEATKADSSARPPSRASPAPSG